MTYFASDDVEDEDDDLIDDIEDDDEEDDDDDDDDDEDEEDPTPEHLKPFEAVNNAIQDAIDLAKDLVSSREVSIVVTNLEQAQLWLAKGTPRK